MNEENIEDGWGDPQLEKPDPNQEHQPETGAGLGVQPAASSRVDIHDLTSFEGVTRLGKADTPADLVSRTQARIFKVVQYYQVDHVQRWRSWKSFLNSSGGKEKWLFYGCPPDRIGEVLQHMAVLPYGEFFPRLLGQNALYFFETAERAARAAFKFGVEEEGFLISCRTAPGNVFHPGHGFPSATKPPTGFDAVLADKGTDLGNGPLDGNIYALFSPERALIRYITHIQRTRTG